MLSIATGTNPALVLNADFRPLSYFPLSLWSWQESVKAVFMDRVNVVSEYEDVVHSPSFAMRLPSVISLKQYVSLNRRPAFTRFNVFLRDRFACQYCGAGFAAEDLTFDHVVPRSRGGRTIWGNVVTACAPCICARATDYRNWPACIHCASPVRRLTASFRKMAAPSRPTSCTKAGGISSIGMPNLTLSLAHPGAAPSGRCLAFGP